MALPLRFLLFAASFLFVSKSVHALAHLKIYRFQMKRATPLLKELSFQVNQQKHSLLRWTHSDVREAILSVSTKCHQG